MVNIKEVSIEDVQEMVEKFTSVTEQLKLLRENPQKFYAGDYQETQTVCKQLQRLYSLRNGEPDY